MKADRVPTKKELDYLKEAITNSCLNLFVETF
jgi:hypothetical protein